MLPSGLQPDRRAACTMKLSLVGYASYRAGHHAKPGCCGASLRNHQHHANLRGSSLPKTPAAARPRDFAPPGRRRLPPMSHGPGPGRAKDGYRTCRLAEATLWRAVPLMLTSMRGALRRESVPAIPGRCRAELVVRRTWAAWDEALASGKPSLFRAPIIRWPGEGKPQGGEAPKRLTSEPRELWPRNVSQGDFRVNFVFGAPLTSIWENQLKIHCTRGCTSLVALVVSFRRGSFRRGEK